MTALPTKLYFRKQGESNWRVVETSNPPISGRTETLSNAGSCPVQYLIATRNVPGRLATLINGCSYGPITGPFYRPSGAYTQIYFKGWSAPTGGNPVECVRRTSWPADAGSWEWVIFPSSCTYSGSPFGNQALQQCAANVDSQCSQGECTLIVSDAMGEILRFSDEECPEWYVDDKDCGPDELECDDCCFDCGEYIPRFEAMRKRIVLLSLGAVSNG